MAMRSLSGAGGSKYSDVRSASFFQPTLFADGQTKMKTYRKTVEKAWRDWPVILTSLKDFGVVEYGYELPAGKHTTSSSLFRIALDEDDLDLLHGNTWHWWIYRALRRFWIHNWFMIVCSIPWVVYQLATGYCFLRVVRQFPRLDFDGLSEHYYAVIILFILSLIGVIFNSRFRWKQSYIVIKVGAQAAEQAVREIWNAEQEKTSMDIVASAPVQTRVGNENFDASKKMPSIKKVKYVYICKFLAAALALNVAVLHEESDPNFEVDDDENPGGPKVDGKNAERVENDDLKPMMYKLLRGRQSEAPPNDLRDSVVIREKTIWQLFEDQQRGHKVQIPDGEKLIDFSGVILAPEVIEIIRALSPTKENEISGVHRHLRVLKHPLTGKKLQMPTPEVEQRMWDATQIIGDHMVRKAEEYVAQIAHFEPPKKWTETMKAEMPEKAEQARQADGAITTWKQRLLQGFNKLGEFMLALSKHARLIGNPGPVANMEDAMSIGPLENLMKYCYPHLITKKLSQDECDEAITKTLRWMQRSGHFPESDDFSAMDSSWTINDRARLRRLANRILTPIRDHLMMTLRNYDHVLDADARKKKIKWALRYITVLMDPTDAILFSGERMTSLMNRWLVLILESAEDLRCLGRQAGEHAILAMLDGKFRKTTVGDGDDNLQGIIPGRYKSQEERINRFAEMYKLLEPCSAPDEKTDAEVLSRYHIWCGEHTGYIHVGKLERNLGRLIAFRIQRAGLTDEDNQIALTDKQLIMICTDVWQRIITLKSTMVVRHFARAVFMYAYGKLKSQAAKATTMYEEDLKRLGKEDGDFTLAECLDQINEALSVAPTSTWAMVKVSHFKSINKLNTKKIRSLQREWAEADQMMSVAEIDDKHILYPTTFFQDFPISSNIMKALGVRNDCIAAALEREQEQRKQDKDDSDTSSDDGESGGRDDDGQDGPPRGPFFVPKPPRGGLSSPPPPPPPSSIRTENVRHFVGIPPPPPPQWPVTGILPPPPPRSGASPLPQLPELLPSPPERSEQQSLRDPGELAEVVRLSSSGSGGNTPVDAARDASLSEGAALPSGPSMVECRDGNSEGVKTAGGPKPNPPNVCGGLRSDDANINDVPVDLEGGLQTPLCPAPPPPGLQRSETLLEIFRPVQNSLTAVAALPQVLNLTSLVAPSSVTSREPGKIQGQPGLVGRRLARTNGRGQGVVVSERRGNSQSPAEVGVIEPHSSPKTSTEPRDRVNGPSAAGGSRSPHCPIVGQGSESHGAEKADRRDRRSSASNAGGSAAVPSRPPRARSGGGAGGPRWKPTRRGRRVAEAPGARS